jgi:hypothetical protein
VESVRNLSEFNYTHSSRTDERNNFKGGDSAFDLQAKTLVGCVAQCHLLVCGSGMYLKPQVDGLAVL